ncbi:MAG: site-2 protease family protein, partial [Mesorhizobium sp.]
GLARGEGHGAVAALLATLAGFSALFNIANLVPVWKFDGGQVLRQICPGPIALALASFLLLSALLALGWLAGFSPGFLLAAGVVFLILSLLTMGSAVKPRHELKPIRTLDRFAMAGALLAVFAIHGYGVLWASAQLV